jgi:hypothetical protein
MPLIWSCFRIFGQGDDMDIDPASRWFPPRTKFTVPEVPHPKTPLLF